VSNAIRFDSVVVHYLARELDARTRARRLRGVRLDSDARRFTLELDRERLVWELHPTRGWIRALDPGDPETRAAAEGWGGRKVPTQRRPRVRRVTAPPDERWLEIEIDAGGPDRASRFVVELLTNQWNVIALTPDRTILTTLWTRETRERVLRPGVPYVPPGGGNRGPRLGADGPVDRETWRALLQSTPPAERRGVLIRELAWLSPLNADAILGAADLDGAWERYAELVRLPEARPRILELGRPTPYPLPLPDVIARPADSLLAAMTEAVTGPAAPTLAPEVRDALDRRIEQVRRRAERLRAELEEAPARAAALRHRADLLMAQLHRVRKGDARVELDDFAGGTLALELDPTRTPVANAQALYDRARKRERAAERLPARVRQDEAETERLERLCAAVEAGTADPAEAARFLSDARPREGAGSEEGARVPYRRYRSSGGLEIRVGRTGRANDELTFHHSAPDDIWLHARDAAGAHVILRWADRDRNPPQQDLAEAAVLAALHSRARTSGTVPVDWTRRKHVRKPRKAPPGAVLPDRVSTLFVEPDPTLPERLAEDPAQGGV
jgi:predicted ribosome quality control (RQC) complex YloA/Tae2 family protein